MKKSVAVIGCGSVGLTALKWVKERNLDVTGFERADGVGGVWRHGAEHSPAYDSLFTNSSQLLMNLSDFPFPFKTKSKFPSHWEILRYFEAYADHFGLRDHIKWNTNVECITKEGNVWIVQTKRRDGTAESHYFDAVVISSGKLWDEKLPDWASLPEGKSLFLENRISLLHSKHYRNPKPFHGHNAVVVGIGNSALDIALELSQDPQIKQVYISCRRGTTVIPTKVGEQPVDQRIGSRFFQYSLSNSLRMLYLYNLVNGVNKAFLKAGMPSPPGGLFHPESPTANLKQSTEFLQALRSGRIKFVSGFEGKIEGERKIMLSDGSCLDDVGAVVCCTGYTLRFSKLFPDHHEKIQKHISWDKDSKRTVTWLRLYKNIMFPEDPSLHFLGMITSFGNETAIGEMQARWTSAMLAGEMKAPTEEEIEKDIETTEKFLRATKPSICGFVRYVKYMDSLAKDLGCVPENLFQWTDPSSWKLAWKVQMGPVVPAQFRLVGRDQTRKARDFYLSSNL